MAVSLNKWYRRVVELATSYGAVVSHGGSGHYRIRHPSGWAVTASKSPRSESRAAWNLERDLRMAARAQRKRRQA